jgi:hypothetical protein
LNFKLFQFFAGIKGFFDSFSLSLVSSLEQQLFQFFLKDFILFQPIYLLLKEEVNPIFLEKIIFCFFNQKQKII